MLMDDDIFIPLLRYAGNANTIGWDMFLFAKLNAITFYKLPLSSCNFIGVFSTSKSWTCLMLTFV